MKPRPTVEETAIVTVEPGGVEPVRVEVLVDGSPRWDRARKLWRECHQAFVRSVDAFVLLGGELLALKTELRLSGSGRRKESGQIDHFNSPRTWDDLCKAETGLSRATVERSIKCFKAIQKRALKLGEDSYSSRLLGTPASELSEGDYRALQEVLREMIGEASRTELLLEFNLALQPKENLSKDTSAFRKALETPEGYAMRLKSTLGALENAAKPIRRISTSPDIRKAFGLAPKTFSDPKHGMGWEDFDYRMGQLLAETMADLEAIQKWLAEFTAARAAGEKATAKRARRKTSQTPKP
jgi:hypothetical protein